MTGACVLLMSGCVLLTGVCVLMTVCPIPQAHEVITDNKPHYNGHGNIGEDRRYPSPASMLEGLVTCCLSLASLARSARDLLSLSNICRILE